MMNGLPCRHDLSRGQLCREPGRLAFYEQSLGEYRQTHAWTDNGWTELTLRDQDSRPTLELTLSSGARRSFRLDCSTEDLEAWLESSALTITNPRPAPMSMTTDSRLTPDPTFSPASNPFARETARDHFNPFSDDPAPEPPPARAEPRRPAAALVPSEPSQPLAIQPERPTLQEVFPGAGSWMTLLFTLFFGGPVFAMTYIGFRYYRALQAQEA